MTHTRPNGIIIVTQNRFFDTGVTQQIDTAWCQIGYKSTVVSLLYSMTHTLLGYKGAKSKVDGLTLGNILNYRVRMDDMV